MRGEANIEKMQVITGTNCGDLAREIAELLDIEEIIPEYKMFKDGETFIRLPNNLHGDVLVVQSTYQPQEANLFNLLNICMTARQQGVDHITAYVPYLCYARADREMNPGVAVSARTVLKLMETAGISRLITLDVHNPDIFEYTSMDTNNIFPAMGWKNFLEEKDIDLDNMQVVAPDQGAVKRAKLLANKLECPYTNLHKTRDPVTGEIDLKIGESDFHTDQVVIVDDIMSTGSTLIEASSLLKIEGIQKIHVLLSHAVGTESVDQLREIGGGIIGATNSIPSIVGTISSAEDLVNVLDD